MIIIIWHNAFRKSSYLSCKKIASLIIKTFVNVALPQLQILFKKKAELVETFGQLKQRHQFCSTGWSTAVRCDKRKPGHCSVIVCSSNEDATHAVLLQAVLRPNEGNVGSLCTVTRRRSSNNLHIPLSFTHIFYFISHCLFDFLSSVITQQILPAGSQVVEPHMHANHTFPLSSSVKDTSGKGHSLIALTAVLTEAEDRGGVTQKDLKRQRSSLVEHIGNTVSGSSQSPTERGGVWVSFPL